MPLYNFVFIKMYLYLVEYYKNCLFLFTKCILKDFVALRFFPEVSLISQRGLSLYSVNSTMMISVYFLILLSA